MKLELNGQDVDCNTTNEVSISPVNMSSGANTLNFNPKIYLDHIEIGLKYNTNIVFNKSNNIDLTTAPNDYFHYISPSLSYNGQLSVGGNHHLSTNGLRLFKASLGMTHSNLNKNKRKANPHHNLFPSDLRTHIEELANQNLVHPWDIQLGLLEKSLNKVKSDVESKFRNVIINQFPMTCSALELYTEFPVPEDEELLLKQISSAVAIVFSNPNRIEYSKASGLKTNQSYQWETSISGKYRDRSAVIKLYKKTLSASNPSKQRSFYRLEVRVRKLGKINTKTNNTTPGKFLELIREMSKIISDLLVKVAHTVKTVTASSIDREELYSAICSRTKIKRTDRALDELFKQCNRTFTYTPSNITDVDYRISPYRLKVLSRDSDGIFIKQKKQKIDISEKKELLRNSKGCLYQLKSNWQDIKVNETPKLNIVKSKINKKEKLLPFDWQLNIGGNLICLSGLASKLNIKKIDVNDTKSIDTELDGIQNLKILDISR